MKKILLFVGFFLFATIRLTAQVSPCNPDPKNIDYKTMPADTTIIMQNGTEITLNRCEFFDIRECLDLREIRTLEDIQQNGLTTSDNFGNTLMTGGMLVFKISGPECPEKCLTIPARLRIPILNPCVPVSASWGLYTADSAGRWKRSNEPAKLITLNGRQYLEFYARCEGSYNADQPYPNIKIKLKAKGIRSLKLVQLSSACPPLNVYASPKHRKNIVRLKVFCQNPDSLMVKADGTGLNGDPAHFNEPLSQLKSKYTKTKCYPISEKAMRRILGIFKLRERHIYRKYIIR